MTDKQWDTIVNLHGTVPFKLVREAAPYFRVRDGEPRNVVNISSTSGLHGNAGQWVDGTALNKIAQVPGEQQYNHHFRMMREEDVNEEVKAFMKMARES